MGIGGHIGEVHDLNTWYLLAWRWEREEGGVMNARHVMMVTRHVMRRLRPVKQDDAIRQKDLQLNPLVRMCT